MAPRSGEPPVLVSIAVAPQIGERKKATLTGGRPRP